MASPSKAFLMRYATFCSGIEAPSVAWHKLGWTPVLFSEIERFPCRLLKHHYPDVPNVGDMNLFYDKIQHDTTGYLDSFGRVDLVCAGTPCQSFSLAGLRRGLDDPRGNLALVYLGIVERIRPQWVVWENVPGVLSSWTAVGEKDEDGGWEETNDFSTFIAALEQLGYGCAWRILDAQYFGVPQRRRRVFVVGYLGDWRRAAAVLFEQKSVSGNTPKSSKPEAPVAALTASGVGTCGADDEQCRAGHIVSTIDSSFARLQGTSGQDHNHGYSHLVFGGNNTSGAIEKAPAVNANGGTGRHDFESEALIFDSKQSVTQQSVPGPLCNTLDTDAGSMAIVDFRNNAISEKSSTLQAKKAGYSLNALPGVMELIGAFIHKQGSDSRSIGFSDTVSPTVATGGKISVALKSRLRRITPIEAERLQGFPDGYTDVKSKKGKSPDDGPRYKAIGNSMAVPVMYWIGRRIEIMQSLINQGRV